MYYKKGQTLFATWVFNLAMPPKGVKSPLQGISVRVEFALRGLFDSRKIVSILFQLIYVVRPESAPFLYKKGYKTLFLAKSKKRQVFNTPGQTLFFESFSLYDYWIKYAVRRNVQARRIGSKRHICIAEK
jgi:hypothetical protein